MKYDPEQTNGSGFRYNSRGMQGPFWKAHREPFEILAVPVLQDNLVYLVCRAGQAVLIDAGEAGPVRCVLKEEGLVLTEILLTHRHADHTAGVGGLQNLVDRGAGGFKREVGALPVPGHTVDDMAWHVPGAAVLFTGDALINGACGRPMAGAVAQLYESLQKISALPDHTLILGGHDYLEENLQFGLSVEPDNVEIRARLEVYRRDPAAALFIPLVKERRTNVFLRARSVAEFAALRDAKNRFIPG